MPAVTLENVPKDLYARLVKSAARNRRSLNTEILVRLESSFAGTAVDPEAHARELETFTARLPMVDHTRVGRYKRP